MSGSQQFMHNHHKGNNTNSGWEKERLKMFSETVKIFIRQVNKSPRVHKHRNRKPVTWS